MAALTELKLSKALDWAYEKASEGLLNMDSAVELAECYLKKHPGNRVNAANALIRSQNVKSIASGFVTGLGGLAVMPVTIPMSLASVLYIQVRMIMAIAIIGGYDIKDDKVKSLVFACLAGNTAREILKEAGVQMAQKLVLRKVIANISKDVIIRINRMVGFRLLTKFGSKGVINLGKGVPVVGGVIGGIIDGVWTNQTGNMAVKWFMEGDLNK
jgi:uncharacterized protein (DUF697 family)